ncbi:DNA-directed RNA polymerase III subunit RPC5 [Geranomyces michiganensis]|nr:DNA-directed RNA polymerase III subunit RPC5 [Geranomyces michiganensis]
MDYDEDSPDIPEDDGSYMDLDEVDNGDDDEDVQAASAFDGRNADDGEDEGDDFADEEGGAELDDPNDDPVIKEVDVFFSQELVQKLCLFQFPTRPHPFDEQTRPTAGRMKPATKRFELEIPLQTRSEHYNRERGEELGQGTDNAPMRGVFDYDEARAPAKLLDKQTFSSSLLPSQANYMVGVIKNDELHLTSIGTALQLRTSLFYIDKIAEKQATRVEEDSLEANKRANPEFEEEGKVLSVTVKGPEDKDAIRKAAQLELQRKAEDEAWMPMKIFHPGSAESQHAYESLFATSDFDVDFTTDPDKYLDDINPTVSTTKLDHSTSQLKKGLTLTHIALLPLKDKLKALLMNANIAKFSTIVDVLSRGATLDEDKLLPALREAAVLVQGAWVVRSELMYVGHALEARRWLLYMFQQNRHISRRAFAELVRIPGPMATSMLSEIAMLEPEGWTLKVLPDDVFLSQFRDVVVEQAEVVKREAELAQSAWAPRAAKISSLTGRAARRTDNTAGPAPPPPKARAPPSSSTTTNVLTQSIAVKGSSMEEQLDAFIYDLLVMHSVSSQEYIMHAVMARAYESDVHGNLLGSVVEEDILNSLEETCIEIRPGLWVRKSLKHTQNDEFRPVVIDLFKTKDVLSKKEVNEAAKAALGKEIPLGPYSKIMHEFATVRAAGRWILGLPRLPIPGLPGAADKTTPADPVPATLTANLPGTAGGTTPVVIPIIPGGAEITPAGPIVIPIIPATPAATPPPTVASSVTPSTTPVIATSSAPAVSVTPSSSLPPSSSAPQRTVLVSVTSTRPVLSSSAARASATPEAAAAAAAVSAASSSNATTKKVGVITATIGGIIGGGIAAAALGIYIFRKVTLSPSGDFRKRMMRKEYSDGGAGAGAGGGNDANDDAESASGPPSTYGSAQRLTKAVDTYGAANTTAGAPQLPPMEYAVYPYDPSLVAAAAAGGGSAAGSVVGAGGVGGTYGAYADYGVEYGAYQYPVAVHPQAYQAYHHPHQQYPQGAPSEYAESTHSGGNAGANAGTGPIPPPRNYGYGY